MARDRRDGSEFCHCRGSRIVLLVALVPLLLSALFTFVSGVALLLGQPVLAAFAAPSGLRHRTL
jgi:hypothetical protein